MADRPATPADEIEITPEMIEAGLEALYGFPITEPTEAEMRVAVAEVFRTMARLRRPPRESNSTDSHKAAYAGEFSR